MITSKEKPDTRRLPATQHFGLRDPRLILAAAADPTTGILSTRAPVAQWIERWVPDPKVAGSSPVGRASALTSGSQRQPVRVGRLGQPDTHDLGASDRQWFVGCVPERMPSGGVARPNT